MADALASTQLLLGQLRTVLTERLSEAPSDHQQIFLKRFDQYAQDVVLLLAELYGDREDFDACLRTIFETTVVGFLERPAALKALDMRRESDPRWYQHHSMVGGVCYVRQFAGSLAGIRERVEYFKALGLTHLHLMPLFQTPEGPDDGGYAVSSYRAVDSDLGTMEDLRDLATLLRNNGISLVLDFVFNHTASDHDWARKARVGDPIYQDYYFLFEDRELPDAYERTLREIFPDEHPGAFTYFPDIEKWVWTTFHTYQWDLNYRNPALFRQMLEEMLFLANVGTEVLRLDAVPFIWKEMGTACENLPQTHTIIRAFNALVRISAPGMVFKSEAIVHPDDVVSYLGTGEWAGRECELSYNPLLMVQLWESLATRHTHLLTHALQRRFTIPEKACWVNYVRSHDDIGWGFADEDAEAVGIHGFLHRQYLNRFYTGTEEGSFAAGFPFQYNPRTEDMRISGTTASLAGLEKALDRNDDHEIDLALRRIVMMYGIVMSHGGLPLIYLGDEIGTLNNYSYQQDPGKADDSRWTHRPPIDWDRMERRHQTGTIEARLYRALQRMIAIRKEQPAFGMRAGTQVLDAVNPHLYQFIKSIPDRRIWVVASFSEQPQTILTQHFPFSEGTTGYDLIKDESCDLSGDLTVEPYGLLWIALHK